jgi:hypothetical protein
MALAAIGESPITTQKTAGSGNNSSFVLCFEGLLRLCARKKFRRKEGLLLINAAIV